MRSQVKEWLGKLTDDDLEKVGGKFDYLIVCWLLFLSAGYYCMTRVDFAIFWEYSGHSNVIS
jgi:hypothetical protein